MYNRLRKHIFKIKNQEDFEALALQIYGYQFHHNELYKKFSLMLHKEPSSVLAIEQIPFLPISFFKTHQVLSEEKTTEKLFTSSGTTGESTSKHFVTSLSLYEDSFHTAFQNTFPEFEKCSIIALLPSYLDRENSSLIYMVNELIKKSKGKRSGFYKSLDRETTDFLENDNSPKILIGVSFALWNLAEVGIKTRNTSVIETGGMKGKRQEIVREQLHSILKHGLGVSQIYSEYGMTELLSQAYLINEQFHCPAWMNVLKRDLNDPLDVSRQGKGALNIIDLANLNSCSFIATDDLGEVHEKGTFDVNGRIDHSLLRGCNLLI